MTLSSLTQQNFQRYGALRGFSATTELLINTGFHTAGRWDQSER